MKCANKNCKYNNREDSEFFPVVILMATDIEEGLRKYKYICKHCQHKWEEADKLEDKSEMDLEPRTKPLDYKFPDGDGWL
jgi:hypothetical protein